MVEGVCNAAATVLGRQWKASNDEIESIAKPLNTILSRNAQIKNTVKRVSAPAVLLGAVGAFVMSRTIANNSPGSSVAQGFGGQNAAPVPTAQHTIASTAGPTPAPQSAPQQFTPAPAPAARPAAHVPAPTMNADQAQALMDDVMSITPGV